MLVLVHKSMMLSNMCKTICWSLNLVSRAVSALESTHCITVSTAHQMTFSLEKNSGKMFGTLQLSFAPNGHLSLAFNDWPQAINHKLPNSKENENMRFVRNWHSEEPKPLPESQLEDSIAEPMEPRHNEPN